MQLTRDLFAIAKFLLFSVHGEILFWFDAILAADVITKILQLIVINYGTSRWAPLMTHW